MLFKIILLTVSFVGTTKQLCQLKKIGVNVHNHNLPKQIQTLQISGIHPNIVEINRCLGPCQTNYQQCFGSKFTYKSINVIYALCDLSQNVACKKNFTTALIEQHIECKCAQNKGSIQNKFLDNLEFFPRRALSLNNNFFKPKTENYKRVM